MFIFNFCSNNTSVYDHLLFLSNSSTEAVNAYFSYPGRYSDPSLKNNVKDEIIDIIQNTKSSLKIYAYSLTHPEVIDTIVKAKNRGVKIKILGDNDKDYSSLIENQIPLERWKTSGLQHIKVILSDKQTMFLGTGNFSKFGLTNDWNGYLKFKIPKNMQSDLQDFLDNRFDKPAFVMNGFYFINSPTYGYLSQNSIIQAIENARSSIHYLIFDHYDPIITHALKDASRRGVQVIGIYDSPVDDEGEYLLENFYGIMSAIYEDGNTDIVNVDGIYHGGLLHHKTMIIDNELLLTGSYNYSVNARDNNREILIGTRTPHIVKGFQSEFERVLNKSVRQENIHYYSREISYKIDIHINGDKVCIEKSEKFSKPIVQLQKGIFKTYLYYDKIENENCFFKNKYKSISTALSKNKSYSLLKDNSFWNYNMRIYDKFSNKIYSLKGTNEYSIFSSSKKFQFVNPNYIYFFDDESISFSINDSKLANKNVTFWSPGKEIKTSTLSTTQFGENHYNTFVNTTTSERQQGIIWIEKPNEIIFFCFRKKGIEINSVIKTILNLWNYQSNIQNYEQPKILKCKEI